MSERRQKLRNSINQTMVWCVAAPILSLWALISFLPIASVIEAWGDVGEVLIALAFLATGALGFIGAAVGYRLLLWDKKTVAVTSAETRTRRALVLTLYAVAWLSLFAL